MAFIIKGGYDALRKQVLNISLKRSEKWTRGLIFVPQNMYVGGLQSHRENTIEIVKYDDMHALLLNDNIIYEDKKVFTYKMELEVFRDLDVNDPNLYDFLESKYVDYSALERFERLRCLN
jgi:hypothetical protein